MADIVLINPKSESSYWGLEHALPLLGKKSNLPPASLPLLAALAPGEHRVTLLDEDIGTIDYDRVARADIVGVTGMTVHRFRMTEVLRELKARGAFTVVGGAWVTVQEDYFGDLADVIFIGEAEETWPRFLREWSEGRHATRYEQAAKTDMTTVPTPRFDMMDMSRYLFGSVQFSRGCPFQCEFCDIIVTFGRRPRIKAGGQVLKEIEALHEQGVSIAFIVDDNLIGNKKGIKPVLRDLAKWQADRGYPMTFFTEASIDLADDPELLQLFREINIVAVFIGIETPNPESLKETKKFQNLRDGGTLVEKVHRIQNSGMDVWCGMILGFDNDDERIFDAQREFLRQSRITSAMIGMLAAIPKTPLHARLAAEGRLDWSDRPEFGTNVIPKLLTREQLRDGYREVVWDMLDPEDYFNRLEALFIGERLRLGAHNLRDYWKQRPLRWATIQTKQFAQALGLFARLMMHIPEKSLRREYRRRVWRLLKAKPDAGVLLYYVIKCSMHYHGYSIAKRMRNREGALVSSYS